MLVRYGGKGKPDVRCREDARGRGDGRRPGASNRRAVLPVSMSRQTAARPTAALGGRAGWSIRWVMGGGGGTVGDGGEVVGVGRYCPMGCGRQAAARPAAASGGRAGRFRSMSMAAGRCPRRRNGEGIPLSVRPEADLQGERTVQPPVSLRNRSGMSVIRAILRTPWSSPFPAFGPPVRTRKTPPPRPASRARPPPPPPDVRTRSVSTRQGRVRKMIPVSVCGACRPEVLWLLHYPASVRQGQYPCRRIRRIFLSFP